MKRVLWLNMRMGLFGYLMIVKKLDFIIRRPQLPQRLPKHPRVLRGDFFGDQYYYRLAHKILKSATSSA